MFSTENFSPETKVLFCGPHTIASHTWNLPPRSFSNLMREYQAIYKLLSNLLGNRLLTIKTAHFAVDPITSKVPRKLELLAENIPLTAVFNLADRFQDWPRDAHSIIDGHFFPNIESWSMKGVSLVGSQMGEGGTVLSCGKMVVASDDMEFLCPDIPDILDLLKRF